MFRENYGLELQAKRNYAQVTTRASNITPFWENATNETPNRLILIAYMYGWINTFQIIMCLEAFSECIEPCTHCAELRPLRFCHFSKNLMDVIKTLHFCDLHLKGGGKDVSARTSFESVIFEKLKNLAMNGKAASKAHWGNRCKSKLNFYIYLGSQVRAAACPMGVFTILAPQHSIGLFIIWHFTK